MLILGERLLEAKRLALPLDSETARWGEALDDTMAERLARLGLIPARKALLRVTLILSSEEVGKTSRFADFPTKSQRHFPG